MIAVPPADHEDQEGLPLHVSFRMHTPAHMRKLEELANDTMTATTLLFLSLGYIPKPNDQARYILGIPEEAGMPRYMTYPSDDSTESGNYSVVWKFKEGEEILDLDPNESVLTELGINRPRIYEFIEVRAQQMRPGFQSLIVISACAIRTSKSG